MVEPTQEQQDLYNYLLTVLDFIFDKLRPGGFSSVPTCFSEKSYLWKCFPGIFRETNPHILNFVHFLKFLK